MLNDFWGLKTGNLKIRSSAKHSCQVNIKGTIELSCLYKTCLSILHVKLNYYYINKYISTHAYIYIHIMYEHACMYVCMPVYTHITYWMHCAHQTGWKYRFEWNTCFFAPQSQVLRGHCASQTNSDASSELDTWTSFRITPTSASITLRHSNIYSLEINLYTVHIYVYMYVSILIS